MTSHFKITRLLLDTIRADLRRAHRFALERVGFVLTRFGQVENGLLVVLAHSYQPVDDADYVVDARYGAVINGNAFRKAMQQAYSQPVGLFHIHCHEHVGKPSPSLIDIREANAFVPDLFHVRPNVPHGALIVSLDSISGRIWLSEQQPAMEIDRFSIVGTPMMDIR